eukprot:scaffold37_cov159-Amphora_coffeaeformis.AAC.4
MIVPILDGDTIVLYPNIDIVYVHVCPRHVHPIGIKGGQIHPGMSGHCGASGHDAHVPNFHVMDGIQIQGMIRTVLQYDAFNE